MFAFYACVCSVIIILSVVSHAVYSIFMNNKKSLSSSGALVKNVLHKSGSQSITLKYVKREMLRRQIACAIEATIGIGALVVVSAVVIFSCYKFM